VNQLGALDSSNDIFYEWTQTPDPTDDSFCAVLIECQRDQQLSRRCQETRENGFQAEERKVPLAHSKEIGLVEVKQEVFEDFDPFNDAKEKVPLAPMNEPGLVEVKREVLEDIDSITDAERLENPWEGEKFVPTALSPEVRVYICRLCGNAYVTSTDLYKHFSVCQRDKEEGEEDEVVDKRVCVPSASLLSSSVSSTKDDANSAVERLKHSSPAEKFSQSDCMRCPCCSCGGPPHLIKTHIVNEVCGGELECKFCVQMFRLHSTEVLREHRVKAKDIPVHLVKDGDARCMKYCPHCQIAEPVSLIEHDDHLLTHPVCVICFKTLGSELGLRRHLAGTHRINVIDLMSDSPKLLPHGPSLPPTISSRLLLLKSLDVFNSEGALIIDSAPLKCEKCSSTFDSVDSLRRHSLSVDICKNCHAPNPSSSSSPSASHLRKPSILKRKPVQALCRKCSSSGGKTLKTGC